ncbi:MAG: phenylalanine--tRNA ligase subunit alpha [Actinobacteria bacterium]|nr:phenylalanine--tRNA ligase subunit alpha [Actinomycetota bacterium]MBW3641370.1 phenylalanine--tRNA ligase subunit alpha [Actinomycetota bacterium]
MSPSPSPSRPWADLVADAVARVAAARDAAELRRLDVELLGRQSAMVAARAALASLPPEERRVAGRALNEARAAVEEALVARRRALEDEERSARLEAERMDLTEVRPTRRRGHLHLVTQARDRLEDVFVGMGYVVADGPEAETDWYNFEALNFPAGHPARNMYDTLYLELGPPESTLLRTHTSPVQVRVMEATTPPIYAVMPGRCYRQDTADASHLPNFHQIEGLVVDRGISFADLAGTLDAFTQAYFGAGIRSRLRPSYFPFTEPSAEFDITCVFCKGDGCRSCGRTGWLELGGCGMVHPNVFRAVGYDPEEWTGFAFGFGIDRMTAQRHGIDDLRELVTNDVRFLRQF